MRMINFHKDGSELNRAIEICATNGPNVAGVSTHYRICIMGATTEEGCVVDDHSHEILFQDQDPSLGLNGITMEAMLAIIIDRLNGFQAGSFNCEENAAALCAAKDAMRHLNNRTARTAEPDQDGDGPTDCGGCHARRHERSDAADCRMGPCTVCW